jgi:hypothetical protein
MMALAHPPTSVVGCALRLHGRQVAVADLYLLQLAHGGGVEVGEVKVHGRLDRRRHRHRGLAMARCESRRKEVEVNGAAHVHWCSHMCETLVLLSAA